MEEVLQLIERYKACVEAWRAHPDYDGNDRYPHVRACCQTKRPESLSFSIDMVNGAYAQFARMAKQRILAEEVKFTIEPIEFTDPVDPWMVLDWWNFPTRAGNKYQAKKLFRELFPTLRPALTQACKMVRMPAHRHPDTKRRTPKKLAFELWLLRQPKLQKEAFNNLIQAEDIWLLANGKISVEEVDKMGIRQFPLIAMAA